MKYSFVLHLEKKNTQTFVTLSSADRDIVASVSDVYVLVALFYFFFVADCSRKKPRRRERPAEGDVLSVRCATTVAHLSRITIFCRGRVVLVHRWALESRIEP
jgi:hypothetical protein